MPSFLAGLLVGACLRPVWRWLVWVCRRRDQPLNVWSRERQQMMLRDRGHR